jgi:hypothetical protein
MGRFSDRVRKIVNPNRQKQIEFNRSVGLNDDARIIPMEQMQNPHNAYFIRLKDNPDSFVKFRNGEYFYEPNHKMACLCTLETGQKFIDHCTHPELELVRLDQIIKK